MLSRQIGERQPEDAHVARCERSCRARSARKGRTAHRCSTGWRGWAHLCPLRAPRAPKPLALSWRVCEDDGVMRSDASLRSGRSRLRQLVRSPLTAHRSPLTAHRSPLTAHRSPLTAHRSPNRALADRSAPVLSATPPIRVAPSRHAWVSNGRRIRPQRVRASHGRPGRSPLPPVHTSMRSDAAGQRRGTSVPDRGGAK